MNTQKTVFNRLFSKVEKTELETHKVELSFIKDFDASFAQSFRFMQKAEKEEAELKKTYQAVLAEFDNVLQAFERAQKASKELGIDLPKEYTSKAKQVKADIKQIKGKI